MTYLDPGNHQLVDVDGQLVEADALKIAEKVHDYDPDLQIICVDPSRAAFTEAPFLVIRDKGSGVFEKVLEAWVLDDKIIERIWASDGAKFNTLDTLVGMENRKKMEAQYINDQKRGHNIELGVSIIRNPKSSYTFKDDRTDDLVTIHENKPVTRGKEQKSFS